MKAMISILAAVSMLCQSKNIIIDFNGKQFKLTKKEALRSGLLSEIVTDQDDDDCDEDMIIPVTIDRVTNSHRDDVVDCLFKEAESDNFTQQFPQIAEHGKDAVALSTFEDGKLKYLCARGIGLGLQDAISKRAVWKMESADACVRFKNEATGKYIAFGSSTFGVCGHSECSYHANCGGQRDDSTKLQLNLQNDSFMIASKRYSGQFLGYGSFADHEFDRIFSKSGKGNSFSIIGDNLPSLFSKKIQMAMRLAQKPMDLIVEVSLLLII